MDDFFHSSGHCGQLAGDDQGPAETVGKTEVDLSAFHGDIRSDDNRLRRRHVHDADCGGVIINVGVQPQLDIYDRGRAADDMGQRDLFACYSFLHNTYLLLRSVGFIHICTSIQGWFSIIYYRLPGMQSQGAAGKWA